MSKNLGTEFECHNKACSLGSRVDPGRFTGGITAEQKNILTGDPVEKMVEGQDYGEGVCVVCGEPGVPSGNEVIVESGHDPYDELHKAVQSRVENEDDSLSARGAQGALLTLVKEEEGEVSDADSEG